MPAGVKIAGTASNGNPDAIRLADVNLDGSLDVVIQGDQPSTCAANSGTGGADETAYSYVYVAYGTKVLNDVPFGEAAVLCAGDIGLESLPLALGDLNGDSRIDFVQSLSGGGSAILLSQSAVSTGAIASLSYVVQSSPEPVKLAQFCAGAH